MGAPEDRCTCSRGVPAPSLRRRSASLRARAAPRQAPPRALQRPSLGSSARSPRTAPSAARGRLGPRRPGVRSLAGCLGCARALFLWCDRRDPRGPEHARRVHVYRPHVGSRRRFDDVLGEPAPGVLLSLELVRDPNLAQGVLTARNGVGAKVRQAALDVRGGVYRAEDRIHWSLALGLRLEGSVLGVRDGHRRPALTARRRHNPERAEHELALKGPDFVCRDSLQVGGRNGLFVVGDLLETCEGPFENLAFKGVAKLFEGVLEGVAARVLAEEYVGAFEPDVLWRHDLERAPVFQDAVLVDPRLMQERVAAHDRLVRRHLVAGYVGDHAARIGELSGIHAELDAIVVSARDERHYDLLQRGVPGPLPYPVYRYLDLPGPSLHPRQGIRYREPQVVVAVNREHLIAEVRHPLLELLQKGGELHWCRVAHRVGYVYNIRPSLDGRRDYLGEVADVGPRRIHRRELDLRAQRPGEMNCLSGSFEDLRLVRAHLVLDVQVGGAHEGVDTRPGAPLHGFPRPLDVYLVDAREPGDARSLHLGSDAAHRLEVALGRDGETRLDHVYPQPGELVSYFYLLLYGERDPRRLLAVSECGVEDLYVAHKTVFPLRSYVLYFKAADFWWPWVLCVARR